jgi:signal transduction histidine kinase
MSKSLLQKNTRYLLIWLPVVLLLCSVLFYIVLQMHAHHMQQKQLLLKQFNVWNAFKADPGNFQKHIIGEYDISEGTTLKSELNELRDTSIYYPDKAKSLPFEILISQMEYSGKTYLITTYISSTEVTHMIIKIFIAEAVILVLLLIAIVILNRKSSGLLWKPFFSTMKKINEFDIVRNASLALPAETGTTEFNELNKELTQLIQHVNLAYHNQKQFVENASHEMQTPLAIIRSKLELLINQPLLTEHAASLLADITEANERLSQMNRTLLLLAKIENNQFPDTEKVNLSELLEQLINNFKNHYDDFPETDLAIEKNVTVHANRSLLDILFSNLLNNAIVHNIPDGKINIVLSQNQFKIENTGLPPDTDPQVLFERFKKGSHQTKTTGLGLALVRQISNLYNYTLNYRFNDGWHRLVLTFH